MLLEKNKEVVRRWFEEAWQREDVSAAVEDFFDPAYIAHSLHGDPVLGIEAVIRAVVTARSVFPDIRFLVQDQVAEGDKVVSRLIGRGTHLGELNGTAPTGKQIMRPGMVMFRLAEGKIVESWRYWDEKYLEELGIVSVQRRG